MRPRGRVLPFFLAAVLGLTPPLRAEAMPFPTDVQVALLLKILTYDRSFQSKARSGVNIGVVYSPASAESVKAKDDVLKTLERVSDRTIKSLPIKYTPIEYRDAAGLERAIRAGKINVIYVSPGLGDALTTILRLSRTYGVTTSTGVPEYVQRGIALGIGIKPDKKPDILINLPSSRSEGSEFDASLLRIATVVK